MLFIIYDAPPPNHKLDSVVGVIATNLSVAPSFHREVIVVFFFYASGVLAARVCVRPAE